MGDKTSEAQKRATKKWRENNKDRVRYTTSRRQARLFAKKHAKSREEVEELLEIFDNENSNKK